MSSVTYFSLSGIFSYIDPTELSKFQTYLSQINNSPIYKLTTKELTYRTVFPEKFELGNTELHLIQNLNQTNEMPDFYEDKNWIVKFYERSPLAAKAEVNARSVVESVCEGSEVNSWIAGLGFHLWEVISKDGWGFRSPEGVETFAYNLYVHKDEKMNLYKISDKLVQSKYLIVEAMTKRVDVDNVNQEVEIKAKIEELKAYQGKVSRYFLLNT